MVRRAKRNLQVQNARNEAKIEELEAQINDQDTTITKQAKQLSEYESPPPPAGDVQILSAFHVREGNELPVIYKGKVLTPSVREVMNRYGIDLEGMGTVNTNPTVPVAAVQVGTSSGATLEEMVHSVIDDRVIDDGDVVYASEVWVAYLRDATTEVPATVTNKPTQSEATVIRRVSRKGKRNTKRSIPTDQSEPEPVETKVSDYIAVIAPGAIYASQGWRGPNEIDVSEGLINRDLLYESAVAVERTRTNLRKIAIIETQVQGTTHTIVGLVEPQQDNKPDNAFKLVEDSAKIIGLPEPTIE